MWYTVDYWVPYTCIVHFLICLTLFLYGSLFCDTVWENEALLYVLFLLLTYLGYIIPSFISLSDNYAIWVIPFACVWLSCYMDHSILHMPDCLAIFVFKVTYRPGMARWLFTMFLLNVCIHIKCHSNKDIFELNWIAICVIPFCMCLTLMLCGSFHFACVWQLCYVDHSILYVSDCYAMWVIPFCMCLTAMLCGSFHFACVWL